MIEGTRDTYYAKLAILLIINMTQTLPNHPRLKISFYYQPPQFHMKINIHTEYLTQIISTTNNC